jgi:TRAP-type C4-dicarboxylate transport system permease small subunit
VRSAEAAGATLQRAEPQAAAAGPGSIGFARLDHLLARITEIPAAILVAVEILVLLAGVISRYGFNRPLTWSDELASILFLWLAMLGAVIALRRSEHMRLGFLVSLAAPRLRAFVETLGTVTVLVFLLAIMLPALDYVGFQQMITTPALEIQDAYRVAAIAVGAALMLLIAAARLIERAGVGQIVSAAAIVGAVAGALWLAAPALLAMGNYDLVIFFVALVGILVALGVPIAFAFGLATLAYLAFTTQIPLTIVVSRMDAGMSGLILLAVPLFVFLGLMMEMAGLARALAISSPRCSAMSVAGSPMCCSAPCIWSPAFRARRPPTWRLSPPSCSPK